MYFPSLIFKNSRGLNFVKPKVSTFRTGSHSLLYFTNIKLPSIFKLTSAKGYSSTSEVRVRFAPSPTGQLHLGGLRTALFNYLYAKKKNGKFILRIEDTDQKRLVPGAQDAMINDLLWAGIPYDEGPGVGGEFGPYIQSQRSEIYSTHINKLLEKEQAYRCFCSKERLEEVRSAKKKAGEPSVYDGHCRHLESKTIENLLSTGVPYSVRFKASEATESAVSDYLRGRVVIKQTPHDDFILMKSDGFPTYHLANVVDDHLMQITHVFRGDEWMMSLPRHVALYKAFEWSPPTFVHLPLLHNPDGSKLSKRSGDVHVASYRDKGYLPESLINFIALLGWSASDSKKEFMGKSELIHEFSIDNINVSSPKVFSEKLRWLNQQHLIQQFDNPELRSSLVATLVSLFQGEYSSLVQSQDKILLAPENIQKVLQIMKERTYSLNELAQTVPYLFISPDYQELPSDSPLKEYLANPKNVKILTTVVDQFLQQISTSPKDDTLSPEDLTNLYESTQKAFQKSPEAPKLAINAIQKALRLSLTNHKMGPPIYSILEFIGLNRVQNRLLSLKKTLLVE